MFDNWLSSRMDFTTEDKRECLATAKLIVDLTQKARGGGLLALEEDVDALNDTLLKKAINLIVDGINQEDVRKILQNYIIVGNYRNRRLLKRILIMEGMLALQRGSSPIIILELLASYFGEGFQPEYMGYFSKAENAPRKKITVEYFMDEIKAKQYFNLDKMEIFGNFDDLSMQALIREISHIDIVRVIRSLPENVIMKFLNNMSKRNAEMIMESCLAMRSIRESDIVDAQSKILETLKELEQAGQIIII